MSMQNNVNQMLTVGKAASIVPSRCSDAAKQEPPDGADRMAT